MSISPNIPFARPLGSREGVKSRNPFSGFRFLSIRVLLILVLLGFQPLPVCPAQEPVLPPGLPLPENPRLPSPGLTPEAAPPVQPGKSPASRYTGARLSPLLPEPPPLPPAKSTPSLPGVQKFKSEPVFASPGAGQRAVKNLVVVLSGNDHFTNDQIRAAIADQIDAIEQSGLSPALADDTAFFLVVFYHKNGYSQAEVKETIERENTLRLRISEGPLTQLGTVTFRGNAHIPDNTLVDSIMSLTRERTQMDAKHPIPFVESEVKGGVDLIRGLYRSEGYLDVVVDDAQITISPDKSQAAVVVQIHEGVQYRFGKLTFQGDVVFYPQRDLLKELEVFTNKPYTPLSVTNVERKVVDFYRSRGYFQAKVRTESEPAQASNGRVPVLFIVESGDIYRFDGVTESGLHRLRPGFLKERFKSLQGKFYNPARLEERYRALMGTGLFSNLKLTQIAMPDHTVHLHFDVEEAKAHELGFSAGYGAVEGAIIGARFIDRDFLGYGRTLSLNAEVAQRLLRGEISYADPWFPGNDITFRTRLYELGQDLTDYTKIETGLRVEFSRKLGKHLEVTGFTLTREVTINNVADINEADVGRTHYLADSIGASFTLDYRDSVLNPTRGFVVNASTDLALDVFGSSLNFARSTLRATYYLPVGRSLLSAGVRGGVLYALSDDSQIPIDERFFNGGSRSVRSYVERSLGPKDSGGHSVGGETFTNANIEDMFPIFDSLDGAVFVDFGSVGRHISSGFGDTGVAVGPGLRYRLPLGPIRIDYGFNPVRKANQPVGAWQVSFGFAF